MRVYTLCTFSQTMADTRTCFVLIGGGTRTDFLTGYHVDLDLTYLHIIQPVLTELGIVAYRKPANMGDAELYHHLHTSDFVVADLFDLAPETTYQLGVRHDLRPNTTLAISEKTETGSITKNPYMVVLDPRAPTGSDGETESFGLLKNNFREKMLRLLSQRETDAEARHSQTPANRWEAPVADGELAQLVKMAESARNHHDFEEALDLFGQALKKYPGNPYMTRQLALVTYLSQLPDEEDALRQAEALLQPLYHAQPNHPETLGLLGAIYKRLYRLTGKPEYLDQSLAYYKEGYTDHTDYYNGINTAFLYLLKSNAQTDTAEALTHYAHSAQIWQDMVSLCTRLIAQEGFDRRADKHWIYQTLAQAHFALGHTKEYDDASKMAIELSVGLTDLHTFFEQNEFIRRQQASYQANHSL